MQKEPEFFDLDKYRLDEECVSQVKLYATHASQLADAKRELAEAKAAMDVVEAELDLDIRNDNVKYNLPKITEGGVKNVIILNTGFQKARRIVMKKQHKVDILEAAVRTLDHRKSSLQGLVSLTLADYYSKPHIRDEETRGRVNHLKEKRAFGNKKKEPK